MSREKVFFTKPHETLSACRCELGVTVPQGTIAVVVSELGVTVPQGTIAVVVNVQCAVKGCLWDEFEQGDCSSVCVCVCARI